MPAVRVPLVFSVFMYRDLESGGIGPPGYANASAYAERLVRVTNLQLKPTGFQLFLQVWV